MTDYINIKGTNVEIVASDPANPTVGQIWYNSTSNTLKGLSVTTAGTWATGGATNTASFWVRGFGSQNDGVKAGGSASPYQQTEEYNGTAWTNVNNMNTGRMRGDTARQGTQTAGLYFGGRIPPGTLFSAVEEYDGSTWTTVTALPATIDGPGGAGTQTAGLSYGGRNGTPFPAVTNEYNGTSWTAGGTMGTAVYNFGSGGLQNSALGFGGENAPTPIATTQSYDGSTWTTGGNLNIARYANAGTAESNSAALAMGGSSPGAPSFTAAELYDGTTWSIQANIPAAQSSAAGLGTTSAAIGAAGYRPGSGSITDTFEWAGAGTPDTQTISVD